MGRAHPGVALYLNQLTQVASLGSLDAAFGGGVGFDLVFVPRAIPITAAYCGRLVGSPVLGALALLWCLLLLCRLPLQFNW